MFRRGSATFVVCIYQACGALVQTGYLEVLPVSAIDLFVDCSFVNC